MILEKGYKFSSQQKFEECLNLAAFKGHADLMLSMLQGINSVFSPKQTHDVLQVALRVQEAVQLLLKNHANVRSRGRYRNAFQAAMYGASKNVVKILIEHGSEWDLSLRNQWMQRMPVPGRLLLPEPWRESWSDQAGPLEAATLTGNLSLVQLLVQLLIGKGAPIDCKSWSAGEPGSLGCGYTALQVAARHGHDEVVDCLLDAGADLDMSSRCFASALHAAIQGSNFLLAKELLERGAKIDQFWGPRYGNCLQICSDQGDLPGVKFLIDNGASINGPRGLNGTALQLSSDGGHIEIVKLLISHDADLEAHGEMGTALQAAAAKGHLDVVQLLFENGAKVNTKHGPNGSALHAASAVTQDKLDLVQLLLEAGAHVNDLDAALRTPLYLCDCRGETTLIHD